MDTNQLGLDLIKRFEGLRLEAYQDVAGIWTIGYGHIRTAKPGMEITEREAESLLKDDLKDAERAVNRLVKVPINENEFSALVSLVFNIGEGAFSKSTTLRLLNKGDKAGAADAIELWNKATIGGKKTVVNGLVRRRAAEKALFLQPVAESDVAAIVGGEDHGFESGLIPEQGGARREHIGQSRSIQGATTTALGGAAAAATGIAERVENKPPIVQQTLDFVQAHSNEILVALGIVILIASMYVIYARLDDWFRKRR